MDEGWMGTTLRPMPAEAAGGDFWILDLRYELDGVSLRKTNLVPADAGKGQARQDDWRNDRCEILMGRGAEVLCWLGGIIRTRVPV